ncbi:MAG: prolyl oligopeptidase family serine peptidase [Gemmataceae bacterium]
MTPARPRRALAAAAALLGLLAVANAPVAGQPAAKKVLTHADYDAWKAATGVTLSPDGKYVAYSVGGADGTGDGEIVVRHVATAKDVRVARGGRPETKEAEAEPEAPPTGPPGAKGAKAGGGAGGSPRFAPDSSRVVFALPPTKAELAQAKTAKGNAAEAPRAVLAVMDLPAGTIAARLPFEGAFTVAGEGTGFLVYQLPAKKEAKEDAKAEAPPAVPAGPFGFKKGGKFGTPPTPGTGTPPAATAPRFGSDLVVRDLATGKEHVIPEVSSHVLSKDGKVLVYAVASRKDEANGVYALDPRAPAAGVPLRSGAGKYSRLVWDEKQTKLAFFHDAAGVTDDPRVAPPPRPVGWTPPPVPPQLHAYVWERPAKDAAAAPAVLAVGPKPAGLKAGWVMNGSTLSFSADGSRLYLATGPQRTPTPEAPKAAAPGATPDRVELDLWHWKDNYIQPMQKVRGDADRNRTHTAVVFLDTKQFRQLGDDTLQVGPPAVGDWALGSDNRKYLHLTGYADPVPKDYALVNVTTGERRPLFTNFGGSAGLSPDGKYVLAYDGKDWSAVGVAGGKAHNLTAALPVKFFNEDDDHPADPPPYGVAGWSTDGRFVLLHDKFDVWKVAADGSGAENLTKTGRGQQVRFRRLNVPVDDEEPDDRKGIDLARPMLLAAENLDTRDTGFFRLDPGGSPQKLLMGARKYGPPTRAKHADTYLLTAQSFTEFPDYHATGPDFAELKRVTDINPTVRDYNWGRAELVRYKSADGVPLSGVLVKPENFDPAKKYPMVVYIYERLSDGLHGFRVPNVTRGQVINPTFYASNGYLVLMPDIAYKVGAPGQSAIKCVLPAIQAVVDQGCVDEKAIGINGQSWGGYQIAYMVTQTNRFRAAVAGAPVSNMVSAYDGVRWGSGMPRQFQYEKGQSRIGETLWKAPMKYIENSPIFMADRVETPLLMIHNDQDDAVPWYQGVEYYLALRRLGKECYLLNYNGEKHNLTKKANARDFAVRMFQFFEHHLRGRTAPEWMTTGVPYTDRDRERERARQFLVPAKE